MKEVWDKPRPKGLEKPKKLSSAKKTAANAEAAKQRKLRAWNC